MRIFLVPFMLASLSTSIAAEEPVTSSTVEALTEEQMTAALSAIASAASDLSEGQSALVPIPGTNLTITVTAGADGTLTVAGLSGLSSVVITPATSNSSATIAVDANGDGSVDAVRNVSDAGTVSAPLAGDALVNANAPQRIAPSAEADSIDSSIQTTQTGGGDAAVGGDESAAAGNLGGTGGLTAPSIPTSGPGGGTGGNVVGESNDSTGSPTS